MSIVRSVVAVGVCLVAGACTPGGEVLDEFRADDAYRSAHRSVRFIDTSRELRKHIGDEDTLLLLATTSRDAGGTYAIPPCAHQWQETSRQGCGQMTLGRGSALVGALLPEVVDGRPTGEIARRGPLIDCSALDNTPTSCDYDEDGNLLGCMWGEGDHNGWDYGCLEVSDGVVWGVTIDNGTADGQNPGQGSRRNAILARGTDGTIAVVRSHLSGARRGVLQVASSGAYSGLVVRDTLVSDTELAALFTLVTEAPPAPVDGATVDVDVKSVYAWDIGRVALIFGWSAGGDDNHTVGRYRDITVASSALGFLSAAEGFLTDAPVSNSTAWFELSNSDLTSAGVGLAAFSYGLPPFVVPTEAYANNAVTGAIHDVVLRDAGAAVLVENDPWAPSNLTLLEMAGNTYLGAGGVVVGCQYHFDPTLEEPWYCGPPYDPPLTQFVGTAADFLAANDGFVLTPGALPLFESAPEP